MKTLMRSAFFLLFALTIPSLVQAQSRIFVASYGNDANDGSRGAPKRNFQAAHDAVAANGQIVVLDTAGYGQLNINKSVSVIVPPGVNGFITTTGANNGITINAGQFDTVSLRGLIIENNSGVNTGIGAYTLASLTVEDCVVRGFSTGIYFAPPTGGNFVANRTDVRDCFANVWFANSSSNTITAALTNCALDRGGFTDVWVNNQVNGGRCLVTVSHCVLTNSNIAIYTEGDGGSQAVLDDSLVHHCTTVFNKQSAAPVVYTRGNNTGVFGSNIINGNNSISTLSAF